SMGNAAFYGCSSLTGVEIHAGVTRIGESAFFNCKNMTRIVIPSSVTSIGYAAFEYCSNLTSVVIPTSVTSIEGCAFASCSNLTSIEIPTNVMSISYKSFYGCKKLTSVAIPSSVTSIGDQAFYNCTNLTTVYYAGTEEEWNEISVGSSNSSLLNAELVFVSKSELEKALDCKGVTVGKLADETEVVIVPTVVGNVAMTEAELAGMLGEDITIVSNNGIIGTGSKIIVGEQEVSLIVKGDIDGDGIATVFDALMVKKALAENSFSENDIREFAGDIDGEGVTDSEDIDAILAHIVGEMLIA
ncbi:MAG: leucine-rich repeat protein, partial [Clostridia bacterium]|nr:leucine-rich repeat protein [Clostridia bacterium]